MISIHIYHEKAGSHRNIGSIEVRIRYFMLNAHYRHIPVIDSLGDVYHLDIDD
ncbi:MAG: hypothetical protein K7J15_00705 [Candidatus Regiella insecticola]|nr:hypothetical protein [Candidatus Regiella insecticola]